MFHYSEFVNKVAFITNKSTIDIKNIIIIHAESIPNTVHPPITKTPTKATTKEFCVTCVVAKIAPIINIMANKNLSISDPLNKLSQRESKSPNASSVVAITGISPTSETNKDC